MQTTTTIRVNTELYKAIKAVAEDEKINLQDSAKKKLFFINTSSMPSRNDVNH